VLTHAELLERNLRNSATSLGGAGIAAEMARMRSDRSIQDLHRHCEESLKVALNYKVEFHDPSNVQENEREEVGGDDNDIEVEKNNFDKGSDDQTAPARHTVRGEGDSIVDEKEKEDSQPLKPKKAKSSHRSSRRFRRKKSSTVHPCLHACHWCGCGVSDVSRLVYLPTVGGPIGLKPSLFCTWSCAKSWNLKYSPIMHRHTRDVLIDLEAGKLISPSESPEVKPSQAKK
jgi:hypothetical protein